MELLFTPSFLSRLQARFISGPAGSSCRICPDWVPFLPLLPLSALSHAHLSRLVAQPPEESPCSHACPPVVCPQRSRQSEPSWSRSLITSLLSSESSTGCPLSSDFHIGFWNDIVECLPWSSPSKENLNHCYSCQSPWMNFDLFSLDWFWFVFLKAVRKTQGCQPLNRCLRAADMCLVLWLALC